MRPLKIAFAAFGSYPDTTRVDFSALRKRGLFVVTGDTGSGKTTIFDAMSYALFGKMAMKPGDDIRSHHADPAQPTFARFTFELDGVVYEAERSPRQERPAKRGTKSANDGPKALLSRIDGYGTTPVATTVLGVNEAIKELIGLTAEQFQRVMVLPQGDVAGFLLDRSAAREELLSRLFDASVYNGIGEALKDRAEKLKREVVAVDQKLHSHLINATGDAESLCDLLDMDHPGPPQQSTKSAIEPEPLEREELETFLDATAEPLERLRIAASEADTAAQQAVENLNQANSATKLFNAARNCRKQLDSITERLQTAGPLAEKAQISQRARPVVLVADNLTESQGAARTAKKKRDTTRTETDELAVAHGLTVRTESLRQLGEDLDDLGEILRQEQKLVDAVIMAEGKLAESRHHLADLKWERRQQKRRRRTAERTLETLNAQIAELDDLAATVTARQDKVDKLDEAQRLTRRRSELETALEESERAVEIAQESLTDVLTRFIETSAPRLAEALRKGEPCPVCGSGEHPAPATAVGTPVDPDAIANAHQAVVTATAAHTEAQGELDQILSQLGQHAGTAVSDLAKALSEAQDHLSAAKRADRTLPGVTTKRNLIMKDRDETAGKLKELEKQVEESQAAVTTAQSNLQAERNAADNINTEQLAARQEVLRQLRRRGEDLVGLDKDYEIARGKAEDLAKTLTATLQESEFDDVDSARAVLVADEDEERKAIEAHAELVEEEGKAAAALQTLIEQGIPDTLPDIEELSRTKENLAGQSRDLSGSYTLAKRSREALSANLECFDLLSKDSSDQRRLAELTARAEQVCRGLTGDRVNLQRWVLARELNRVVRAASVHLKQMTNGRYTIVGKLEAKDKRSPAGLDLEVFDAHTGRTRSPQSLSGGEQFQASLALALGLADVVSQGGTGSGKRFEALFVDEGFGALDPAALDDAIESLHQLHDSGRMVGVITHVEAMKERLHPGIIVNRLPDGRGSTLRVNP